MGYGYGMGGMWLWWLFGLLLVVGLVLLAVLVVRSLAGGTGSGAPSAPGPLPPSQAREILDERYARGEVSTEEYHERLRSLDQRS
jgi:putative membrane protein